MEPTVVERPAKGRAPPWFGLPRPLRTSGQTATPRKKRDRLAISEPFGPIKNSRGPDFTRSDKLIIIDAIKDCVKDDPSLDKENSLAVKKVRRISASFPQGRPPLADSPTIASSDVVATTSLQVPPSSTSANQLRKASLASSCSSQGLASTSRLNLLSRLRNTRQDENAHPDCSITRDGQIPPSALPNSKLPRSRTMSVLHDLKTSVSRPSLAVRSPNTTAFNAPVHQPSLSSMDTLTTNSSHLRLPRTSLSSLARSSQTCTPEPHHSHITHAQSSQYWSGRFVALRDRYLTDNLGPEHLSERMEAHNQLSHMRQPAAHQRPTHLSLSTTTSALTTLTSSPVPRPTDDKDSRCRRIFDHLDSLCTSSEAKRSLHDWQQSYARQHDRASLLPHGGSMESRGLMARLFGGGAGKSGRRSSLASQDTSTIHRVKRPARRHYPKSS